MPGGRGENIPINNQRPPPPTIVDRILKDLDRPGRLHHNVEPVRVVLLDLLKLRHGVGPRQLNVMVGRVQLPGEVHLEPAGRGDGHLAAPVLAEELG